MKNVSFEENIKRLETIVESMEKDDLSLQKSLKMFEEGIGLVTKCNELLNKTEQKIEILVKDNKKGFTKKDFSQNLKNNN